MPTDTENKTTTKRVGRPRKTRTTKKTASKIAVINNKKPEKTDEDIVDSVEVVKEENAPLDSELNSYSIGFRVKADYRWNFVRSAGIEFTKNGIISVKSDSAIYKEISRNPYLVPIETS